MLRIFCALALVFLPWGALAQNDPFDHKRFSPRDLRMIQGGLVEWNEYNGLLDGKWGPASQGALERHIGFFFRTAPTDYLAALVAKGFNGGGEKWVTGFIPEVPLYSAAPVGLLRRTDLDGPHTTLATPNQIGRAHV